MDVSVRPEGTDAPDVPDVPGPVDTLVGDGVAVPRPAFDDGIARRVADRLDRWRQDARVVVAVILLCCAVTGTVWYRRAVAAPRPATTDVAEAGSDGVDEPGAPESSLLAETSPDGADHPADEQGAPAAPASTAKEVASEPILVHVAGAVSEPGVVEVDQGARVVDAIEAAGGAVTDADLDRLNLAAVVGDGQRILVARVGDDPTPIEPEGGADRSEADEVDALVDLNAASTSELESLPGIGPTLAAAIVEEREGRGGFTDVGQLLSVPGIGEQRLANLRDLVTL